MIITDSHANDLTAPTDDNSGAPPRDGDATAEFQLGQQLTAEQRDRLQQLLERYGDVFSDTPGTTHLMEHEIKVTDQIPCFQASYRVPEAMKEPVDEELTKMLENAINTKMRRGL